jgi:hypothetical protein
MPNCYKDFTVTLSQGGSDSSIYGNSVSITEDLALETAESLGVKGSSAVFNLGLPRGSISVESYITSSLTPFTDLEGNNDNEVGLQVGPYSAPQPCWMTSMEIGITPGEPLSCSRSFDFVGGMSEVAAPSPISQDLNVAIPQGITLDGYDSIDGTNIIKSASWSLSQTYEEVNLLGDPIPIIIFKSAEITLGIEGENLTIPLVADGESCVVPPKDYTISIIDCDGGSMGTLTVNGYMQSRGTSIGTDSPESTNVSVIQYL